ncbi:MAG TPA: fumarylacetoacetate hydrolase family protein [Deltaproteobacteria bacterium]|nr:fumarylacetoacetate hydrolase family protein [Deltaproteobacteria bacterium]HPR51422.1 fumarylacetoacetate hydrolase family protein [Deltaproteobacteria bacterium]
MKIGRALSSAGDIVWYQSEDGREFIQCDPETFDPQGVVEVKRLLAPTIASKIVAVGLNYRDHAEELGLELPKEPILFMKPATSVIGPLDDIVYPPQSTRVDYEAELAVVISKDCKDVKASDAAGVILGYTCLNDVTARDLQVSDGQWTRAKSFDTFAPIGPWIETDIGDPHSLAITSHLNGECKQSSNTKNLIFSVFELVEFISGIMTLNRGDVIATGTPSGIGPMNPGDEIAIELEGIGVLKNRVR